MLYSVDIYKTKCKEAHMNDIHERFAVQTLNSCFQMSLLGEEIPLQIDNSCNSLV